MTRIGTAAAALLAIVCIAPGAATTAAGRPNLAGRWTFNASLSSIPSDLGFTMSLASGTSAGGETSSGGRRGGAAGATRGPAFASSRESADDAARRDRILGEVRTPSRHLTITQTDTSVTFTDERGHARLFETDGRQGLQALSDQLAVPTVASWQGDRLEIRYSIEQSREVRYTWSRTSAPQRLVAEVQLVERGNGDKATLVYEPTRDNEATGERAAPLQGLPPAPAPGVASQAPPSGTATSPAAPATIAPLQVQRPDAVLKGLKKLGVVFEDLSSQAAACGLKQASIEAAVGKSLTAAGLQVVRNSDEDTYLYVQIMTAAASTGLCVSRYDVSLYTHTMATLTYQASPVLVQVVLLHEGGISGGSPAVHGEAVNRMVKEYVDGFGARIRDVNR